MLKVGILKPVHEAAPWINSFVHVKRKNKPGNLKLTIYLEPTNFNKAIVWEPCYFKIPEDNSSSAC